MKITVRKFTAKDTKDWDDFVNQSNNGTIFHLRSFLFYYHWSILKNNWKQNLV